MRQLRAKAVQANRQAQGKSTLGGASRGPVTLPNSRARGVNLPKVGASVERGRAVGTPSPGRQARATAQGQAIRKAAADRRVAKATSERMSGVVKAARTARSLVSGVKNLTRGGAVAAGLQAYNTGDGTLTAAKARGDLEKTRKPTAQETSRNNEEKAALRKLAAKKSAVAKSKANKSASSFDSAFRDARRAGVSSFTWNGKKYTTQLK